MCRARTRSTALGTSALPGNAKSQRRLFLLRQLLASSISNRPKIRQKMKRLFLTTIAAALSLPFCHGLDLRGDELNDPPRLKKEDVEKIIAQAATRAAEL